MLQGGPTVSCGIIGGLNAIRSASRWARSTFSVVLLRIDETSDSGQPVWVLKVSEPLPRTDATQLRKPESSIRPQPIEALRVPPTRSHFDHDHRNPNERQSKAAKRHCAQRAMSVRSARHWAPCPVAAFAFGKPLRVFSMPRPAGALRASACGRT